MILTITINTANEAFADDPVAECARILTEAMRRPQIERALAWGSPDERALYDFNGNRVGEITVRREPE